MDTPPPQDSPDRLFEAALDLPAEEREAFLATACGDDAALLAEVCALLAAHEEMPSGFLASPVAGEGTAGHFDATIHALDANRTSGKAAGPVGGGGFRPTPVAAESSGDRIGPYKLLQEIGEGGFGTVWMADQEQPVRRRVALKIIKLGMDTKEVVARFEQERQALAMMDHPNIARVFDAGATEQGRPFFVMELVRGMKITDYCDEKGLSTAERVELFILVCQAVQHAHQKGIIHRDLKPSNILVTVNDGKAVPKVIDFGVAKATQGKLADGTLFTQFEQMIGTPLYMSPEQAEMTSLDVDTRSDIYSLGVLLYELLTGRTPIDMATMAKAGIGEIRRIIREVDAVRPSARLKTLDGNTLSTTAKRRHTDPAKLPGTLRGDIDWIVMKCLEKDRARRYDTANGLALDLQRHLANEVVIARPPTAAYLLSKLIRRNKLAFAAGAAIAVSLVIGISASVWQAVRATQAEKEAVTSFDELRATAPAFAEQARGLAAKEQYADAIAKLDYAIKLRPDAAEFLVAKGDLLQCQLQLAEAAAIYREALRVQPGHARAEASAKLCEELLAAPPAADGKLSRESLAKLHVAMQQQQRPAAELLPVARLLGEEKKLLLDYWLARLKDLPVSAEHPLARRLTVREDGRLALDLSDTKVTDLSPLTGAPLATLNLGGCAELTDLSPLAGLALVEVNLRGTGVTNLAPLREMHSLEMLNVSDTQVADLGPLSALRLKRLDLRDSPVTDLTPLQKMPLEELNLRGTRVSNLSPITGAPIKSLDLSMTPLRDFSPLARMPLEKCYLENTKIADLSVLRGKPLRELVLTGCRTARNYAVLAEIKTLELLLLDGRYRTFPAGEYEAIGALRSHPNLRQIGAGVFSAMEKHFKITSDDSGNVGYAGTGSKNLFWQEWDRDQTYLPALRKSGIHFDLHRHLDGLDHLIISDQPLRDLSILKGAPIGILTLRNCPFSDLTPIRDLKLKVLQLTTDLVADLSPLRGMPLETVKLSGSKFSDLSPLAGLPIKSLYLDGCPNVIDIAALAQIPTLENVTVPKSVRNLEELRKLPKLERIAFSARQVNVDLDLPDTSAAEFWDRWTGLSWMRALNDAGVQYAATEIMEEAPKGSKPGAKAKKGGKGGVLTASSKPTGTPTGRWRVTINAKDFSDCSIFKGATDIEELNIASTQVADLRPLEGLSLTKLDLRQTKVTDLSSLRAPTLSSSLRDLNISELKIADFSPLSACSQLEQLRAYMTDLADLSVVRHCKLRVVRLAGTKITDLSALAGMPLELVQLNNTTVTDISPLLQCRTLKQLVLPADARDVAKLRSLPDLVELSFTGKQDGRPDQKAADFWKKYEAEAWMAALRESGVIVRNPKQLEDGTWEAGIGAPDFKDLSLLRGAPVSKLHLTKSGVVDLKPLRGIALTALHLGETKVADLSPLHGMPLDELVLTKTLVADLVPLKGMPLKRLHINHTRVESIEPLRGMPLESLLMGQTKVSDLSALHGMPLISLKLGQCENITDLTPLAETKTLTSLTLPPNAKEIEFLRAFPNLERISYKDDADSGWIPAQTAAEFWEEYDAKNKP